MKAMKPKTVLLCLVLMGCMPSIGYAQNLQEAIDEALIVPLAKLEAQVAQAGYFNRFHGSSSPEEKADEANSPQAHGSGVTTSVGVLRSVHPIYPRIAKKSGWEGTVLVRVTVEANGRASKVDVSRSSGHKVLDDAAVKAIKRWSFRPARDGNIPIRSVVVIPIGFSLSSQRTASSDAPPSEVQDKYERYPYRSRSYEAARAAIIDDAKAKAQRGKKRARHCRATLKPVVELVEIVKCVQIVDAIADACSTATEQFRLNKRFQVAAKFDTLKAHVTQCVTANIAGYSALVHYIVTPETKDRYAGLIEKCRQEETNTLGVLGYEFIWPCFKGYLDMIDEPLEPPPTKISPEPKDDSETLPKVKA